MATRTDGPIEAAFKAFLKKSYPGGVGPVQERCLREAFWGGVVTFRTFLEELGDYTNFEQDHVFHAFEDELEQFLIDVKLRTAAKG